jgi:hypothetical protein
MPRKTVERTKEGLIVNILDYLPLECLNEMGFTGTLSFKERMEQAEKWTLQVFFDALRSKDVYERHRRMIR